MENINTELNLNIAELMHQVALFLKDTSLNVLMVDNKLLLSTKEVADKLGGKPKYDCNNSIKGCKLVSGLW